MTETTENTIRVVAAVADKAKVLLYKEDGDIVTVHQGDYRLQALLDEIIPITARGEVAVVSLTKFSAYADFEKRTNGVVRFFRTKRRSLGSLAGNSDPNAQVVIVNMEFSPDISAAQMDDLLNEVQEHVGPWSTKPMDGLKVQIYSSVTSEEKVTQEVSTARLTPMSAENNEEDLHDDETIVAVIGDLVIPDVEKLKPYILHAVQNNSVSAVEAFLHRLANMVKKRSHSIMELMKFLERADLPISEDGSIIAYKVLNRKDHSGNFADPHTGNVIQKVGSRVSMAEELVDPSRSTQCSAGLHVARRAYLRGFAATDAFLIKIAPEDIVAVPHGEPDKMRVCAYHLIAHLPDEAYNALKANTSMTSHAQTARILENAIKGEHIGVIEQVRIGGPKGSDLTITPEGGRKKAKEIDHSSKGTKTLDAEEAGKRVEPRDINKRVNEEIAKTKEQGETKSQRDARKKREKRAAERLARENAKQETTKPAATKKATQKPVTPKNKKRKSTAAASEEAAKEVLTKDQKAVLKLHRSGSSQSEIAKNTGVSRRTIGRWIEKYGT